MIYLGSLPPIPRLGFLMKRVYRAARTFDLVLGFDKEEWLAKR